MKGDRVDRASGGVREGRQGRRCERLTGSEGRERGEAEYGDLLHEAFADEFQLTLIQGTNTPVRHLHLLQRSRRRARRQSP